MKKETHIETDIKQTLSDFSSIFVQVYFNGMMEFISLTLHTRDNQNEK